MKLAVSMIAWDKEDNARVFSEMKTLGFDYLEIAPTKISQQPYTIEGHQAAQAFAKMLDETYGLKIASMQSILYGVSERLFADDAERERLFDYVCLAIDYAKVIGCPNLVFGSPKNRIIEDPGQYELAVAFFKRAADYAEKQGVYLSLEANPTIYGTNFINTHEAAFDLVETVNQAHFGVNVDLGTVIENEESLDFLKEHLSVINHIHISEPYLNPIQKRDLHQELFDMLEEMSYDKVVSIEMKQPEQLEELLVAMAYVSGLKH